MSEFGQFTTKGLERWGFCFSFGLFFTTKIDLVLIFKIKILLRILSGKVRIDFCKNLIAGRLQVDTQTGENTGGHSVAFTEKTKENMLGSNVGMIQLFRFLVCESEDLFNTWGVWDVG